MAHKLCVTKVTVEYAIDGKSFTVQLDPMKVGSVFFSDEDKNAAKQKQTVDNNNKEPVEHFPKASGRMPAKVGNDLTHATTVGTGTSSADTGPALWWRTDDGVWFHPGG